MSALLRSLSLENYLGEWTKLLFCEWRIPFLGDIYCSGNSNVTSSENGSEVRRRSRVVLPRLGEGAKLSFTGDLVSK